MKKHTQLLRLTLAFGLACLPLALDAQQVEKLPRVGLLGNHSPMLPLYDGFRQGLREAQKTEACARIALPIFQIAAVGP